VAICKKYQDLFYHVVASLSIDELYICYDVPFGGAECFLVGWFLRNSILGGRNTIWEYTFIFFIVYLFWVLFNQFKSWDENLNLTV
jgi:hypothetical protein